MAAMKDITEILYMALLSMAGIQLIVYWLGYRRMAFYKRKDAARGQFPVSIIICARNEENQLKKNLPSLLEQDYPDFEVIVVNDCSWDETDLVLIDFEKKYSRLKVVTIKEQEKYSHGKKFAVTLGIKAASNEYLLFTDADCRASGNRWLALMQRNFSSSTDFVLGYGPYEKGKNFLNKLIRFDAFFIAIQYLSASLGKAAYMGVGRNLAYKKSVFFEKKGFAKHNHILSGDDDLFVNENATSSNTSIEIDPGAFTYSEPRKTFGSWMSQKKRHMSTWKYYKFRHKMSLMIKNGSLLVYYLLLIPLFILKFDWRILVTSHAVLLLVKFPIIYKAGDKLNEKDLAWLFPLLEIIHTFLQPLFFIANLLTKQKTWK
jgi:glycosyltransferase involved in cell wall biosynthesis